MVKHTPLFILIKEVYLEVSTLFFSPFYLLYHNLMNGDNLL